MWRGGRRLFITRETDYALRIIRELADGEMRSVTVISEHQFIPQAFGYKITKKLSNAGWIEIYRGVSGGCVLSVDLSEKSIYDLMVCMNDHSNLLSCSEKGFQCHYRKANGACAVHKRLVEVERTITDILKSYKLNSIITDGSTNCTGKTMKEVKICLSKQHRLMKS